MQMLRHSTSVDLDVFCPTTYCLVLRRPTLLFVPWFRGPFFRRYLSNVSCMMSACSTSMTVIKVAKFQLPTITLELLSLDSLNKRSI